MVFYRGWALIGKMEPDFTSHSEIIAKVLSLIGNNCMCMPAFLAIQAPLLKKYPANLSVAAYSYLFGAVPMVMTAIFMTNESTDWSLTQSEVLAVIYAVSSFMMNYLLRI
ncbi:hypothetical protein UlMin_034407 [Ulmus minor]